MAAYQYITLRQQPRLMEPAARWFHSKWGVPTEAYLECMEAYLKGETELGWYLCLDGENIVGGLGAIENDFHDRKDLSQVLWHIACILQILTRLNILCFLNVF